MRVKFPIKNSLPFRIKPYQVPSILNIKERIESTHMGIILLKYGNNQSHIVTYLEAQIKRYRPSRNQRNIINKILELIRF